MELCIARWFHFKDEEEGKSDSAVLMLIFPISLRIAFVSIPMMGRSMISLMKIAEKFFWALQCAVDAIEQIFSRLDIYFFIYRWVEKYLTKNMRANRSVWMCRKRHTSERLVMCSLIVVIENLFDGELYREVLFVIQRILVC